VPAREGSCPEKVVRGNVRSRGSYWTDHILDLSHRKRGVNIVTVLDG